MLHIMVSAKGSESLMLVAIAGVSRVESRVINMRFIFLIPNFFARSLRYSRNTKRNNIVNTSKTKTRANAAACIQLGCLCKLNLVTTIESVKCGAGALEHTKGGMNPEES